jgi:orotidine-5'-phosphate decarboxylase
LEITLNKKEVIIACDFGNKLDVLNFLSAFENRKLFLKVGMELFYSTDPKFIKELGALGYKIFLDLKLCDIPNTVYKAVKRLAALNAEMLTIHAFGGSDMMFAARKAAGKNVKLLAVTVLTGISEEVFRSEVLSCGFREEYDRNVSYLNETVVNYAISAMDNGFDGVVCSPKEVKAVKDACGEDFLTVTPGIRYVPDTDDQVRTCTPAEAGALGSDFIVVGRPITRADNPLKEYEKIVREFCGQ